MERVNRCLHRRIRKSACGLLVVDLVFFDIGDLDHFFAVLGLYLSNVIMTILEVIVVRLIRFYHFSMSNCKLKVVKFVWPFFAESFR